MAYSEDLRRIVLDFKYQKGHTWAEVTEIFGVRKSAVQKWKGLLLETGSVAKKPLNRGPRVFDSEKLRAYVEKNPFATLQEIADEFGGSDSGAYDALKRERITLKNDARTLGTRRNETRRLRGSDCRNPLLQKHLLR